MNYKSVLLEVIVILVLFVHIMLGYEHFAYLHGHSKTRDNTS